MLTVADALAAMDFYRDAFGAVEQSRFTSPSGHVVAEPAIDGHRFFVVDENPEAFNVGPRSLDATTVRMNLIVDDPDAMAARAVGAGARRSCRSPTSPTAFGRDESPTPRAITG